MTDTALPAPYPPETRAKGWRFELDYERIRQSDTWALATPDLRPWLLMLWMVAWEQTPCGSLPDDDGLIAARIGMPPKALQRHRTVLMRGWWRADDGRLYHGVMTTRVLEMLARKEKERARKAGYRQRTAEDGDGTDTSVPPDSRGTDAQSPTGQTPESLGTDNTGTGTGTIPLRGSRATRLPADWEPGETGLAFAATKGLTNGVAQAELEKFRDHWAAKPGKDGTALDWQAKWRTWVRNSLEFRARAGKQQGGDLDDIFRRGQA